MLNNDLKILSEHFKRLRNLKYNFHTIVDGYLLNLYDVNNDPTIRSYHHLLKYEEKLELFAYPIMITKDLATSINDYIKELEVKRKELKIKPKEVLYKYTIKEYERYIDMIMYVEGFEYPNYQINIPLILKSSVYYKKQLELMTRIHKLYNMDKLSVVYSIEEEVFDILSNKEDIEVISIEIGEREVPYSLASSLYFSLRKPPKDCEIQVSQTTNEFIYLTNLKYKTETYDENHICFILG